MNYSKTTVRSTTTNSRQKRESASRTPCDNPHVHGSQSYGRQSSVAAGLSPDGYMTSASTDVEGSSMSERRRGVACERVMQRYTFV